MFEFCNLTRTPGAEKVLRSRMERPWSNAARILDTQQALTFIAAQREAFSRLPATYVTNRVETYVNDILPTVVQDNFLEFTINAFSLWTNFGRDYIRIVHGVQVGCRLIRSLRLFIQQKELELPRGELAPLMKEMRVLLASSGLSRVPDHDIGNWGPWRTLRLDQVFRVHETVALNRLLKLIYEMEALVSFSDVTHKHEFVLPCIKEGPLSVYAKDLVHPFVKNAVANPVEIDQQHRVLFLTGPNMAGKTTYLRAFATALYLAHLGMGVPASRFHFVPAQRLFSSISLTDNLRGGVSYFRAEALRVKVIAKAVAQGFRVVAIMDEPFKGTNVKDALDASLVVLERFASKQDCLFMFSSHLIELCDRLNLSDGQIDCRFFEADEGEGRLRFNYQLRQGVSSQRLGMRVLREEGVFELLNETPRAE